MVEKPGYRTTCTGTDLGRCAGRVANEVWEAKCVKWYERGCSFVDDWNPQLVEMSRRGLGSIGIRL